MESFVSSLVFWVFATGLVAFSVLTVAGRSPVSSAMSLVATMIFVGGILITLQAYFLGMMQVMVYAGAVMVLFLFIIMLLNLDQESVRKKAWVKALSGVALCGGLFWILLGGLGLGQSRPLPPVPQGSDIRDLGRLLFTEYLLPFELTAVLLLVAIVGVILLCHQVRDRAAKKGGA